MRLANHDGRATIVVDVGASDLPGAPDTGGARGVDVATLTEGRHGPDPAWVLARWVQFRDQLDGMPLDAAAAFELDERRLGAPSPRPAQVFGIGMNYAEHAAETGKEVPERPATFTKFPTCIVGPRAEIPLPADTVDWEVELVVVIAPGGRHIARGEAWGHVAGLTVGQDVSERVLQAAAGGQFCLGKSHEAFGPTGPWLVTPDELADPDDLELTCSLDGEEVQRGRTSDMVFDVATLIEELSSVVELRPGDLVFTGTPPGVGVGRTPPRFLESGTVIESWIEGIGTMRNATVEPTRQRSAR